MDSEGTFDARGTRSGPVPPPHPGAPPTSVPRPANPPDVPRVPALPGHAPTTRPTVVDWLRTPRPPAGPGVWRLNHRPRPDEEPDLVPGRQLLSGALIAFLCGWLFWSLLWNNYLEGWWIFIDDWWTLPMEWPVPDAWTDPLHDQFQVYVALTYLYYGLVVGLISVGMGRVGNWAEVWRRYGVPLWPLFIVLPSVWRDMPRTTTWLAWASSIHYILLVASVVAVVGRIGTWPAVRRRLHGQPEDESAPQSESDPVEWPDLRAAGLVDVAETLTAAARAGSLGDVDYARIRRAWQGVHARPDRLTAFTDAVRRGGPAACAHPSGVRDLPVRKAVHDLATGQVRIGVAVDDPRNPYSRRTTGVALDPGLLGTSLLAVGPSGAGKSVRLVRPVVESLCLLALANRAAVVAVTAYGSGLAPDDAFDLVIAVGRPESTHDLDLYGGSEDPDEAARTLAEALVGDLAATTPGGDSRRAATALAQLIGPYRSVYGRFPAVPELRELLGGSRAALDGLRAALEARGGPAAAQLRELDARERQSARADDIGVLLAERIAFLDRPAFAEFFRTDGGGRQFSLRAVEHPLRVRIDLPERGHAEASRIVARLVLAQFTEAALTRSDRSLFAALVVDDATDTMTADSVRSIQRLRSANAGVVLALRTLEDVPEPLRGPLLGAVGCRMAFAGLAPWDGNRFAETWGTEWVQTRDVTNRQIISDEPLTKALHLMRRLVTGKAATAEAVTVREVERARWSSSDLAHGVPAGHAVLSLTTVRGEHAPPLLVDLRT
ncbi:ATP/GTP-binding protein [Streptomyces sp. NPDC051018]|uniref:ATP/GTP-binding protein n=1 Tax=Streptomyces sp. NPDC051018 TaxID=3365639 RepID=UPI003792FF4A